MFNGKKKTKESKHYSLLKFVYNGRAYVLRYIIYDILQMYMLLNEIYDHKHLRTSGSPQVPRQVNPFFFFFCTALVRGNGFRITAFGQSGPGVKRFCTYYTHIVSFDIVTSVVDKPLDKVHCTRYTVAVVKK